MSAGNVDTLMELWEASLATYNDNAPFVNCEDMYRYIDTIPYGKVQWQSFTLICGKEVDESETRPFWMEDPQIVWYRDLLDVLRVMLANPAFDDEFDYVPYHRYLNGVHRFRDFMSGDWAWKQAVSNLFPPFFLFGAAKPDE